MYKVYLLVLETESVKLSPAFDLELSILLMLQFCCTSTLPHLIEKLLVLACERVKSHCAGTSHIYSTHMYIPVRIYQRDF